MSVDFAHAWVLVLLPIAALPLLRRRRDTLVFSNVAWLPVDRVGRIAGFVWRALAVVAIVCTLVSLSGPGRSETEVMRTGRGAEILVLMDRSRSMDDRMLTADWKQLDPTLIRLQAQSRGEQKGQVARKLLAKFVAERPDDRFAIMFFSANPIHVVPFTQHDEVVQAAITAGGVGRGLSDTDVGWALITAIKDFDQRRYTGSRIILLVSDGGAKLDEETRRDITEGLRKNRIALNWIYLRSVNGPDFVSAQPDENAAELVLHRFFQSLPIPYRAYQAQTPEDLAQAIAEVGKQQNFPLDYPERIPRRDFSGYFFAIAAACCLLLFLYHAMQLKSFR